MKYIYIYIYILVYIVDIGDIVVDKYHFIYHYITYSTTVYIYIHDKVSAYNIIFIIIIIFYLAQKTPISFLVLIKFETKSIIKW